MSIFSWFGKAKTEVGSAFVKLFGQEAAQQFGTGVKAVLSTALGAIVTDAVAATATLTLDPVTGKPVTPADKQVAAFKQVMATTKANGISVSASVVNMLIELAVQTVVKKTVL